MLRNRQRDQILQLKCIKFLYLKHVNDFYAECPELKLVKKFTGIKFMDSMCFNDYNLKRYKFFFLEKNYCFVMVFMPNTQLPYCPFEAKSDCDIVLLRPNLRI